MSRVDERYDALVSEFPRWEKTKDLIEQLLDIMLNYRQSGHPGGSRSKLHAFLVTLLSGVMRWDIRHPEKRFGDRFVLGAGHTVPMVYSTLALFNEAMRVKYQQTGDAKYAIPKAKERMLTWEDLAMLRRNKGLSGHAEMEGKSLFLKFNTGPSGHGSPAAAGEAVALKRAGAEGVKVFIFEGEGGLTPGVTHETMNSAWGLALDNLYYVVDWNDFGIDAHTVSSCVYGSPRDWYGGHGWRVFGTEQGSEWGPVTRTMLAMTLEENPQALPSMAWVKTRKGRGYLTYDYASHGVPHKLNDEKYWQLRKEFAAEYGAQFVNVGGAAPKEATALREECLANLKAVIDVLHKDQAWSTTWPTAWCDLGDSVPSEIADVPAGPQGQPLQGQAALRLPQLPEGPLPARPGSSAANRNALAKWGAWVNSFGAKEYGRPIFLASSADLAESTNIAGFARGHDDFKGWDWFGRNGSPEGALLTQQITEFANSGIMVGMASVNLSTGPGKGVRRLLGSHLDLRLLLLPPVRTAAPLQPARAGLPAQGGQGDLRGRPLGPGDGRGQPHALRHLLAGRYAALPRRPHDQPLPVGAQRGAGPARRGPRDRRPADHAAPYPAADRDPRPRRARHPVALRGGAGRLRGARLRGRQAARRRRDRAGDERGGEHRQDPPGPGEV